MGATACKHIDSCEDCCAAMMEARQRTINAEDALKDALELVKALEARIAVLVGG